MNILLFGATGMVGQGALRECLLDQEVQRVCVVGRSGTGISHVKLDEILHNDLWSYAAIEQQLAGFDACLFCLGVSSAGMSEADYAHVTYDMTLAAASTLVRLNPAMTFIYVSGTGTDSSEKGSVMWARVKGKTENALLRLPFRSAYMFRPAMIQPLHGIQSKTGSYRILYSLTKPLLPLLLRLMPSYITTTEHLGKAMLAVVRHGAPHAILESRDISAMQVG